jgi:hypothetical protein
MDLKKTLNVEELGDSACLSELIALVERALNTADAMGLPFVGLDLCAALEKLKEMERSLYPSDFS